jgi:Animal haem peroxidase
MTKSKRTIVATPGSEVPQGAPKRRQHGKIIRGLMTTPQSPSFVGMFGRMFRTLPAAVHSEEALRKLGRAMIAEPERTPTSEEETDSEENLTIDAGYTYLGQFIDHDLTFDPSSFLQKLNDPNGIVDYRTPRFDLDCIYGRGPDDQPYMYLDDGRKMLLGRKLTGGSKGARDLPRLNPNNTNSPSMPRRALIGDPRNDENIIVSQLQGIFLRFHNRMADIMYDSKFEDIQQAVRWHYQWIVLNDFLPTIVGKEVIESILPHLKSGKSIIDDRPQLRFYHFKEELFMPVEFSVAAYRFGHSMIRPIYRLNTTLSSRQAIFNKDRNNSLVGFREFPDDWAIDWNLFFGNGKQPSSGKGRTQKSYKIDTSLVDPLGNLPPEIARTMPSLAERNLVRGLNMGLPSGQAVSRYMGIEPITDKDLKVGKATVSDSKTNKSIIEIDASFEDNAPLWYYILAEAQHCSFKGKDTDTIILGPVGKRIVAEVFIGLLLGDSQSFISLNPTWKPFDGTFTIRDLVDKALEYQE